MKKKMFMTAAVLSAVYLLGACGRSVETKAPLPEPEDEPNTDTISATIPNANKGNETDAGVLVTNLTQQDSPEICIDYAIKSYEPLQRFSYDLFRQNIQKENPVISPVSAYLALAMAGLGSDGTTRTEFQNVLGEDMEIYSDNLMNTLPINTEQLTVSLANSAWLDNQFIADETWLGTIKSFMHAEAFQSVISDRNTMNSINNWVKNHTNGLIEQMLEDPLDPDTRLALFNTVYFKAKWDTPFEQQSTYTEQFQLDDDNQTVDVSMMHQYGEHYAYISNEFAEGVILPYQSSYSYNDLYIPAEEGTSQSKESNTPNLALVALKPIHKENYHKLYEATGTDYYIGDSAVRDMYGLLTDEVISDLLVNRQTKLVNLKLPKFEITFDKVFNESLQNIGLKKCFDEEQADFGKLGKAAGGGNLYISLVRQKAKIIVDEEGTEAAAATEVAIMECTSLMETTEDPIDVYFDEPFLYMIMDMDKEIPLFIGIMDNPAA